MNKRHACKNNKAISEMWFAHRIAVKYSKHNNQRCHVKHNLYQVFKRWVANSYAVVYAAKFGRKQYTFPYNKGNKYSGYAYKTHAAIFNYFLTMSSVRSFEQRL